MTTSLLNKTAKIMVRALLVEVGAVLGVALVFFLGVPVGIPLLMLTIALGAQVYVLKFTYDTLMEREESQYPLLPKNTKAGVNKKVVVYSDEVGFIRDRLLAYDSSLIADYEAGAVYFDGLLHALHTCNPEMAGDPFIASDLMRSMLDDPDKIDPTLNRIQEVPSQTH